MLIQSNRVFFRPTTDKLAGNITYTQDNLPKGAYSQKYVAYNKQISLQSELDDYHSYLQNVTTNWYINGTLVPNITEGQLNYTLKPELCPQDLCNLTTIASGTTKENLTVSGRIEQIVHAFEPLDSLNMTGIPNISWKRNRNLEIDVHFVKGSKPFWYCYRVQTDEKSKMDCNDPDETTEDYFKVTKRFSKNGTYYLKIKAGNIVTQLEKTFPITVIDCEWDGGLVLSSYFNCSLSLFSVHS